MAKDNQLSIMVVDNDPLMARTIKAILEKRGLKVQAITNPILALEACKKEKPDFLITELAMTPINGYDFIDDLKQKCGLDEMSVIALTVLHGKEDRKRAKDLGINSFINKDTATISEIIQKIASLSSR